MAGDGNDIIDARRDLQRLDFMPSSTPHRGHDGALRSAGYVRLVARFADPLDDVFDLRFSCSVGHIDDHLV